MKKLAVQPIVKKRDSKKMNTAPVVEPTPNGESKAHHALPVGVVMLPLSEIEAKNNWNVRSGAWQEAEGGDDEYANDFAALVLSLETEGQDTPVVVRPSSGSKHKYLLVGGFRRYAALKKLADESRTPKNMPGWTHARPVIRAEVRTYNDDQARAYNLRENTCREGIKPADLAWGVHELKRITGQNGVQIASDIGKDQKYVTTLLGICELVPDLAKKWRQSSNPISVMKMDRVARTAKIKGPQEAALLYDSLVDNKQASDGRGTTPRGLSWLVRAQAEANKAGYVVGSLVRIHAIDARKMKVNEETVRSFMTFRQGDEVGPEGATQEQVQTVVDAFRLGVETGQNAVDLVEEAKGVKAKAS